MIGAPRLAISMPVFNEEARIYRYIEEILETFEDKSEAPLIILVNDCSTDSTKSEILRCLSDYPQAKIEIAQNPTNLGHGRSTTTGIAMAIDAKADYIITTDGDGQISATDIRRVATALYEGHEIVEGIRKTRERDTLRRKITFGAKICVFLMSRRWPKDANTPLRGYRSDAVEKVVSDEVQNLLVPNIFFSAYFGKHSRVCELDVEWRIHREREGVGSSWSTNKIRRSVQLLNFSIRALWQLLRMRRRI